MAQFCYECFKEIFDFDDPPQDIVFSRHKWLCEGCGEEKYVVISICKAGIIKCVLFKLGFYKDKY